MWIVEEHIPGRSNSRCRVPRGKRAVACICLDKQEGQCDLNMTSEGRMVEVGLETLQARIRRWILF